MTQLSPALHVAVRNSRRVRGRIQLRSLSASGAAPSAVVNALRKATLGRGTREEQQWIRRIELMRKLLLTSPDPLEIVDFGAGTGAQFDDGRQDTTHVTVRALGDMARSSKPPQWAYLLFRLVRELRVDSCLEMGACVGISAAYQAAALELNGRGSLITLEGSDVLAARSTRTLDELGLSHRATVRLGRFADTLPGAAAELDPLGMAFIDGHHVESATLDYMEQILPHLAPEAVIVFDDINWSDGMRKAWAAIVEDDRFALTVDLRSVGLAVRSASAEGQQHITVPYY